jgi:hypothetical protein
MVSFTWISSIDFKKDRFSGSTLVTLVERVISPACNHSIN